MIALLRTEQSHGNFQIAQFYEKGKRWKAALIYYNEVLVQDALMAKSRTTTCGFSGSARPMGRPWRTLEIRFPIRWGQSAPGPAKPSPQWYGPTATISVRPLH